MARRNLYELNYAHLVKVLGRPPMELLGERSYRYRSEPFMDLVVERLPDCAETGAPILSLAHYYARNGDLCQDPEMVVRVFPPEWWGNLELVPSTDAEHGRVEALMFIQAIPPIFDVVYPKRGFVRLYQKRSQNQFLSQWLRNLEMQGHEWLEEPAEDGDEAEEGAAIEKDENVAV